MELLGIEISLEEFDRLMCEQSQGKELVIENGKIIARDRIATQEEIKQNKIEMLKNWFNSTYTHYEQKYRRLHTLGLKCDDGSEPIEKLKQLYNVAEEKRREIQRLEQGGENNGTLYDNTL